MRLLKEKVGWERAFSTFFLPLILVDTVWRLWISGNCNGLKFYFFFVGFEAK